jgi:Domain of unknown function (DUF4494)
LQPLRLEGFYFAITIILQTMPSWYLGKIKYQQEQENGALKSIAEAYLIDAVSYTEAEARLYRVVADSTPDFQITSLTRMKLADVFHYEDEGGEKWFKCKVVYVSFDESKNKEKKIVSMMLVNADSAKEALERTDKSLSTMLIPYEITDVNLTPILDVHPYVAEEAVQEIPAGFRPLSEIKAEQALNS